MHTKLERLLSKSLTTLEVMAYYLVVHTGPGVSESALGLTGSMSVCCDWVRYKVGSTTSILVWQHVYISKQIRP